MVASNYLWRSKVLRLKLTKNLCLKYIKWRPYAFGFDEAMLYLYLWKYVINILNFSLYSLLYNIPFIYIYFLPLHFDISKNIVNIYIIIGGNKLATKLLH